jgi:large conductance mechanosensitive channel
MLKEFREFAMRGNVMDMAVGIILGSAFGKIVGSLVDDVIMPPIGLLLGRVNFTSLFLNLSQTSFATLDEATKAGAPIIKYGVFLNTIVNFVIVAFVLFLLIRQMNRLRRDKPAEEPNTKPCPFCLSAVPKGATRCAFCTSELRAA